MPRVKRGVAAHKKHKKIFQLAEGQRGARHRLFRPAHEAVMRSLAYAYRDRRTRKRDMRRLWIVRINAAARMHGLTYGQFIHGLSLAGIAVDRKMLADLAVFQNAVFGEIVTKAKVALQA